MNTTKRDLVVRIAEETKLIQQDVYTVVQKFLDYVTDSMVEGNNVELRNFGVFEVRERKQRVGRNPNKPEQVVTIPTRKIVKFKPGKIMRQRVGEDQPRSIPYQPTTDRSDESPSGSPASNID